MDCEKLLDKLDRSASYRKKEINNISIQIQSVEGDVQKTLLRAAVVMLYAHFEGFSKDSIKNFIKYLNSQNIPVKQLKHHLQTLHYTKKIIFIKNAKRKQIYNNLIEDILTKNDNIFSVNENEDDIVTTESNLKSEVLEDLLFIIGISTEDFIFASDGENKNLKTKEEFIDREILGVRNAIAHGEGRIVTVNQFEEIKKFVLEYIDVLKDYIIQMCTNEEYLKSKI